ncbi:ATP-binding protein [Kitasatospora sp. NPDC057015]|uniref:sensor histidine kinase n=1 Tax=Kitasatospora sp. NPDC057015 TaxID=3346001 RepID=UPI00363941A1
MADLTGGPGGRGVRRARNAPAGPAGPADRRGWRALARRLPAAARRLRPVSVRARATTAACAVVAVALGLASWALLALLHANLLRTAEDGVRQQAEAVAQLAAQGRLTPLLPLGHGTDFIQVVDADGTVRAVSQNLVGGAPLGVAPHPAGRRPVQITRDVDRMGEERRQRVVTVTVATPDGVLTVHVGASLRSADAAVDTTTAALAVACPLLLLTVGLVTWRATGRALRPVEAIRAEVAAISDRALHRRVPLPRSEDEIADLATTMNAMLDRLDEAGRRQRQFIADASHELRSPLTVLRTQLEVALAHPDPVVRSELVRGALEDTERLQNLATDLLLLARLDAGTPFAPPPDRAPERIDLTALVATAVRNRPADPHPVELDLQDDVRVQGNALWLTRLLTNLLDNAQRHTETSVRVVLRSGADAGAVDADADPDADPDVVTGAGAGGAAVLLEVHDDGPGIAVTDRQRVFERFTRLDDARSRDHGGAGLGLPIARDIARHHGGTLVVAASPRGARLRLRLPAPPVDPAAATPDRPGGRPSSA